MPLTVAQLAAVKADILADNALNALPNNSDGNSAIAAAYAQIVAPDFFVYRTNIPVADINDQIVWANLTPSDAPDTTQVWANRSLACQGKQFNLQLLLQGSQVTINGAKANVRAGLQDALTNVPSGTAGALKSAGWVPVRDNALARKARRIEKLLADTSGGGTGGNASTAATMTFEGPIGYTDIEAARNS
jgi:hypothetical protein